MYFTNCFKFFADAIELMASDQKQSTTWIIMTIVN